MKSILKNLMLLGLVAGPLLARGQISPVLDEYIQTGMNSNLTLQQKQVDVEQSLEAVRQAKGLFYPTLQFNANYTRAAGGRSIDFPIGDLLNPVYQTLNSLTQSNSFPLVDNAKVQFLPDNFQETYVQFQVPVFNSDIRYNRRLQEINVNGKSAFKSLYIVELRYNITQAYLQYLQTLEAEKIVNEAMVVLTELRRFNESLVRNNVATKDIVATADYELSKAQQQHDQMMADQQTARAYFNFLINQPLETPIGIDPVLSTRPVPLYSLDSMQQLALQNRQELKALKTGLEASETAIQLQKANKILPDVYIGGQFGFQGYGYHLNGDQAYVLARAGLSYDLYSGGQHNSKIQQAQLGAEKTKLQYTDAENQIALQVAQAWYALEAGRKAVESAQSGKIAAEASFKIIQNKYRANQVLLIELLDAQNRLNTAKMQVTIAQFDLLQKEAYLRKTAGL